MKFSSFFSATILVSLGCLLSVPNSVDAHGHEVRSCINTAGDLRIFVEHWHSNLADVTAAGTMEITDDTTGITSTLTPTGLANDVELATGGVLPGCPTTTLNAECVGTPLQSEHDWVYYDFPFGCNANVSYTLEQGNTVVLMEACAELYPATINPYEDCPGAPSESPSSSPVTIPSPSPTTPPTPIPTTCSDDASFTFQVGTGSFKKCKWVSDKIARQLRHCGKADVQTNCPLTCCNCGTCPTLSPTPAPVPVPQTSAPTPAPVSVAPTPSKGGKGGKGGKGKDTGEGTRRALRGH